MKQVECEVPFLFSPDRIGTPINWLLSGVGRAYLAFCPEEERQHFSSWCANRPTRRIGWGKMPTAERGLGRDTQQRIWHARLDFCWWFLRNFNSRRIGSNRSSASGSQTRPRRDQHHLDQAGAHNRRNGRALSCDLQMAAVEIVDSLMKRPTIRVQPQSRDGDQGRGRN